MFSGMKMSGRETKIIIAGFGGQGVVVAGNIIARGCVIENKNVTGMVSYGAEMRGGTANATVIISDGEIASPFVEHPDAAIILNQPSLDKFESRLGEGGLVVMNSSLTIRDVERPDLDVVKVEATDTANRLGNVRVANIVASGAFIGKTKLLEVASIEQAISDLFSLKKPEVIEINVKALKLGAGMVNNKKVGV